MAHVRGNQFRGGTSHGHDLTFERLSYTAVTAVDSGANSDLGRSSTQTAWSEPSLVVVGVHCFPYEADEIRIESVPPGTPVQVPLV